MFIDMLNESQKEQIAQRLTSELDLKSASKEDNEAIDKLVFGLAFLPDGHDTEFLLDNINKDRKDRIIQQAARICLEVILGHPSDI